jgi:hypothetical protein
MGLPLLGRANARLNSIFYNHSQSVEMLSREALLPAASPRLGEVVVRDRKFHTADCPVKILL